MANFWCLALKADIGKLVDRRFGLLSLILIACLAGSVFAGAVVADAANNQQVSDVESKVAAWLKQPVDKRGKFADQDFAKVHLNKDQAASVKKILWEDYRKRLEADRKEEWTQKKIVIGDDTMKFDYKVYGEKPESGRSLFISMHGGGTGPARMNEQQWRNQINLYKPDEGVYLAPRAPTNTWNMWHRDHIDKFFTRIIQDAMVFEDVDVNKVYFMGYSAGGDGVYQMAPRMADSLAAAAMMAGHPNGVSPMNLRNIGFTIHMGGKDKAYKRNEIAAKWKTKLAELAKKYPGDYKHEVTIHEEFGHWMRRKDAVAVPWMAKFVRDPLPSKISWRQSGVIRPSFYWLATADDEVKKAATVFAAREKNHIDFEGVEKMDSIRIRLNDSMVDFDQPIEVTYEHGDKQSFAINRTAGLIHQTIEERGDPDFIFSAEILFKFPSEKQEAEVSSSESK